MFSERLQIFPQPLFVFSYTSLLRQYSSPFLRHTLVEFHPYALINELKVHRSFLEAFDSEEPPFVPGTVRHPPVTDIIIKRGRVVVIYACNVAQSLDNILYQTGVTAIAQTDGFIQANGKWQVSRML